MCGRNIHTKESDGVPTKDFVPVGAACFIDVLRPIVKRALGLT